MMENMYRPIALIALLTLSLACQKEKTIETPSGDIKITEEKETVKLEGEVEGKKFTAHVGEGSKIPSGFPEDIQIPSGATITGSFEQDNALILTFSSNQAPNAIGGFYERSLQKAGWNLEMNQAFHGQQIVAFSHGNEQIQVMASPGMEGTDVVVTFARQIE